MNASLANSRNARARQRVLIAIGHAHLRGMGELALPVAMRGNDHHVTQRSLYAFGELPLDLRGHPPAVDLRIFARGFGLEQVEQFAGKQQLVPGVEPERGLYPLAQAQLRAAEWRRGRSRSAPPAPVCPLLVCIHAIEEQHVEMKLLGVVSSAGNRRSCNSDR